MRVDDSLYRRRLSWDDARRFTHSRVEFLFGDEPGSPSLALDVVAVSERPSGASGHQFAILFRGPRTPFLAQRTYRVRHPELGDFPIFVTAVAQTADSTDYEACFAHVG